eukprot:TRINITY_DN17407_c0_g1_i1.p1 TRINITY_DN17407_c0_g1~~TRINITY_DN17407_c0_g1_i1.p1  ORF type:complete len:151 (+),score=25.78 TRINITY_DN17407_c0_g1_i1:241-693(+)
MTVPKMTLNPNAPSFVPQAFLKPEDFSPEWYALVKENAAFGDFWLRTRFEVMDDGCGLSGADLDELEAAEELEWQQRELADLEEAEELERGCTSVVGSNTANEKRLIRLLLGRAMRPAHGDPVAAHEKVPRYVRNGIPRIHAQRIQQPRA